MGRDRVALTLQVLDLALRGTALALGLGPGVLQDLVGVRLGVRDRGVGGPSGRSQLGARVLLGLAADRLGLLQGAGGPALRRGGPLLGGAGQLLQLGDGGVVPLGVQPLGLLALAGQRDLVVGGILLGLGVRRLEHAAGLSGELVGFLLGHQPQLVRLALGLGPQLGDLPLGRGAEPADLALQAEPLLGGLGLDRRPELLGVPLGRPELVLGLALSGGAGLLGLLVGGLQALARLPGRRGVELVGGRLGARAQFVGLAAGLGQGLVGVTLCGGDHLDGLLLGQPEELLDAGSQTGVRGAVHLAQLALGVGQLVGELEVVGVELLDGAARLAEGSLQLGDLGVDLLAVVSAHHDSEGSGRDRELLGHNSFLRGAAARRHTCRDWSGKPYPERSRPVAVRSTFATQSDRPGPIGCSR